MRKISEKNLNKILEKHAEWLSAKHTEVADFDENRWNECAPGIHFFITRDEAVRY